MQKDGLIAAPSTPKESRVTSRFRPLVIACLLTVALYYRAHVLVYYRDAPDYSGSKPSRVPSATRNPAYIVTAKNGAVASENEQCSRIGVDLMKAGGNAVDAMVGTTLCIGVVSMFSSGIGGGGFMTVRIPPSQTNGPSEVYSIDFRETAPALSNATMYVEDPTLARFGGLAVGVPGELRGLQAAHTRWGRMQWNEVVQPSVDLAAGWKVGRELGQRIGWFAERMLNEPDWKAVFAPEGRLLTEGETIRRTSLSRTLAIIAREGPGAFYEGPIAEAIVEKVRSTGGILTLDDMKGYQVQVKRALQGEYRGRKVYTPHAPTSGPVLLHMLNLLEHYDDFVQDGPTAVNVHRYLEAMKFGFAARTKIGDPAYHDSPELIDEIPTKAFSNIIFPNITDDTTHPPEYYNPLYDSVEDHGTSHSSVVDEDGMAVSLTSTVNLIFGSGVLDPVTGIILNDEMDDFATPGTPNAFGLWPSPYNYPAPGKRPLSSTVPLIMEHEDGSFYAALGGSGGSRTFPAVFQVMLNLDWGMDMSAAIEHGRLHDQLFPTIVDTDDIYPAEIVEGLLERGHNVTLADTNRVAAVVNGVMRVNGTTWAASDSRKNGIAAGY